MNILDDFSEQNQSKQYSLNKDINMLDGSIDQ